MPWLGEGLLTSQGKQVLAVGLFSAFIIKCDDKNGLKFFVKKQEENGRDVGSY